MEAFWFANESEWIEEYPQCEGVYVYQVVLHPDSIVEIEDGPDPDKILHVGPQDLEKFEEKYTFPDPYHLVNCSVFSRMYRKLNKDKLAKDYGGVYFSYYDKFPKGEIVGMWYSLLDVSSGSIWKASKK